MPTDGPVAPSISISGFPSPAPTTTETSKGAERGLPVAQTRIRGRASSASWDIAIPVFSGPVVAAEANRRVRAAANDLIAQVRREAKDDRGVKRTLTGTGTVGTIDGRTVQVTIMYTDFLADTARPSLYVTTTVVEIRRAWPVLLTQVIPNPPEGLRFLRTEVVKAAKQKGDPVDAAGAGAASGRLGQLAVLAHRPDLPLRRVQLRWRGHPLPTPCRGRGPDSCCRRTARSCSRR